MNPRDVAGFVSRETDRVPALNRTFRSRHFVVSFTPRTSPLVRERAEHGRPSASHLRRRL